jgi:hypothetical protein
VSSIRRMVLPLPWTPDNTDTSSSTGGLSSENEEGGVVVQCSTLSDKGKELVVQFATSSVRASVQPDQTTPNDLKKRKRPLATQRYGSVGSVFACFCFMLTLMVTFTFCQPHRRTDVACASASQGLEGCGVRPRYRLRVGAAVCYGDNANFARHLAAGAESCGWVDVKGSFQWSHHSNRRRDGCPASRGFGGGVGGQSCACGGAGVACSLTESSGILLGQVYRQRYLGQMVRDAQSGRCSGEGAASRSGQAKKLGGNF